MKGAWMMIGLASGLAVPNVCSAQIFNDPFAPYLERSVTIWPGAGNGNDTNAAIHTIDPWPAYSGYTRIPGRGENAVNSIVRLNRFPNPFLAQQPGLGGGAIGTGGTTGIGGAVGGLGTEGGAVTGGSTGGY